MPHPDPSPSAISIIYLALAFGLPGSLTANEFKSPIKPEASKEVVEETPEAPYYGGRGLITLEGPAGLFINPTSGTLPRGKFTLQYCLFFPNSDTDNVGHGWLLGFGVTDWLEVGAVASLIDFNAGRDREEFAIGPQVRVRLLRDKEWWREVSVGTYSRWRSPNIDKIGVYVAASKRFIIDPHGFFRSFAVHGGYRHLWFEQDNPVGDTPAVYGGVELELPYRIYVIGEINSQDDRIARKIPFAFGLECRLPGVALSVAGLQSGSTDRIGIWSGIGISFGF